MNELLFCHHRATDLFLDRLSAQSNGTHTGSSRSPQLEGTVPRLIVT